MFPSRIRSICFCCFRFYENEVRVSLPQLFISHLLNSEDPFKKKDQRFFDPQLNFIHLLHNVFMRYQHSVAKNMRTYDKCNSDTDSIITVHEPAMHTFVHFYKNCVFFFFCKASMRRQIFVICGISFNLK